MFSSERDRFLYELSDKQYKYMEYLLECLQFSDGYFRKKYLDQLEKHKLEYCKFAAQPLQRDTESGQLIFPKDHKFKQYVVDCGSFIPRQLNIVDLIKIEFDLKRKHNYFKQRFSPSIISATDISNFTFCPVSWSISKTYRLPALVSAEHGTTLHKQQRLASFIRYKQPDGTEKAPDHKLSEYIHKLDCDKNAGGLFSDLSDSIAVFIGSLAEKEERGWFVGRDKNYVGQPDYIFYNLKTKKYFVVEEKFHMIRKAARRDLPEEWCIQNSYDPDTIDRERQKVVFYDNHLNQLRSYIYGIPGYGQLYGYLVYWRYSCRRKKFNWSQTEDKEPQWMMEQIRVHKVHGGSDSPDRYTVRHLYDKMRKVITEGSDKFDASKRSPSKCAGCINNLLCGHKTGNFERFDFPYNPLHLKTKWVPFPEDLRKENKKDVNAKVVQYSSCMHSHVEA